MSSHKKVVNIIDEIISNRNSHGLVSKSKSKSKPKSKKSKKIIANKYPSLPRSHSPQYIHTSATKINSIINKIPSINKSKKGAKRGRKVKQTSQKLNERLHKLKYGDDTLSERMRKLKYGNKNESLIDFTQEQFDRYLDQFVDEKLEVIENAIESMQKTLNVCCLKKSPKRRTLKLKN